MTPELKWVSSCGGPFLLTTRSTARNWRGIDGLMKSILSECSTDYERACRVRGYAEKIDGNPHEIVVLDNGPEDITWIGSSTASGLFVKWLGADSDEQVVQALEAVRFSDFRILPILVEVGESELVAFDSALTFSEAQNNHLALRLDVGCYEFSVLNYSPSDRLSLSLLHFKMRESISSP